jgi:hypothetical protein
MRLITPQTGLVQGIRSGAPYISVRGIKYCDEAVALFARMDVQPNTALKNLIDTTIRSLKSSGCWNLLDVLQMYCLHTEQASLLNWKGDFCNGTNINSCQWTELCGYLGEVAKGVNTNYNPYINGVNYTTLNAFYGGWFRDGVPITAYSCGAYTTSNYNMFRCRQSSGSMIGGCNSGASFGTSTTTTGIGLTLLERLNTTSVQYVRNGTRTNKTNASGAIPDLKLYFLAVNYSNNPNSTHNNETGQGFVAGGGFDLTKHVALYNGLSNFISNLIGTLSYGEEMVVNGGFDSDSDWGKEAAWTISGGKAIYDDTAIQKIYPLVAVPITVGSKYKLGFTISGLSTGLAVFGVDDNAGLGGIFWPTKALQPYLNGTYELIVTCQRANTNFTIYGGTSSGSSWSLDNFSIKPVL